MKRSILVLLAAALLNIGVLGSAPAQAATPDSYSPGTAVSPMHHHRHHDDWWHDGDRHHHHHDGDDDDWGHDGRHHQCDGLIVVCLLDR